MTDRFDAQLDRLVALGYPELANQTEAVFRATFEPLRAAVPDGNAAPSSPGHVPWVIVVPESMIDPELLVPLMHLPGSSKQGVLDRNHGEEGLSTYRPLDLLQVPASPAYLLVDVERGEEFCNVRPQDALPVILGRDRTPLTIAEGIAFVTQYPEVLEKNKCFMLSGSRRGDKRVPALWISERAPKLGWCWDGNPHTWLGTASARQRATAG